MLENVGSFTMLYQSIDQMQDQSDHVPVVISVDADDNVKSSLHLAFPSVVNGLNEIKESGIFTDCDSCMFFFTLVNLILLVLVVEDFNNLSKCGSAINYVTNFKSLSPDGDFDLLVFDVDLAKVSKLVQEFALASMNVMQNLLAATEFKMFHLHFTSRTVCCYHFFN